METTVKRTAKRATGISDPEIAAMQKDLLSLLLKKVGFQYDELVEFSVREWVADHLDLLTESELKKFKRIIL
jgi:hypothetical protein